MALKISIETDYGINAEYWRIARATDHFHGQVEVVMAGFLDIYAADEGRAPLATITVFVQASDATRSDLYPLIKQQSPFVGAEDA